MVKKPVMPVQSNAKPAKLALLNQPTSAMQRQIVQPKFERAPSRPSTKAVVQAYIPGGLGVLQARMKAQSPQVRNTNPAAAEEKKRPAIIQRKGNNNSDAFRVNLQPKTGGQRIPDQVRTKMETALGMDFSDVRIHIGPEASSIGALAYTWGTNIHFAPGQYNPHTLQGQKILGHELWHVVQQKSGRVANPFGDGVAVVQDYGLEAEADRMAIKAALTPTPRAPRSK